MDPLALQDIQMIQGSTVTVKGELQTRSPDFSLVAGAEVSKYSFTTN